ncbi:hypothetical protein Pelo_1018 [Pelomyxa schiedti]|nr:hypothetical protein Pelo_1018 [Pelomyxa schiedti]
MIEFRDGILARDQAAALLLCQKAPGSQPMHKQAVSLLPQCVLRELIQSWVLEPSRCVAIAVDSPWGRPSPFTRVYVLFSVSHTLGVTGGTPKVLKLYNTPDPNVRFLSPTVILCYDSNLLCAVDLTGKRDTAVVGGPWYSPWNTVYNHKWLVLNDSSSLKIWRLCQSFPKGDPVVLDVAEIRAQSNCLSSNLFLTRSQAVECIADGDELCIAADKMGCCIVRIVDIQKCFDSGALVITKEFSVARESTLDLCCCKDVITDRHKRLFLVHTGGQYHTPFTLIQDVVTGVHSTIFYISIILPVGDTHYVVEHHDRPGVTHFSVFEIETNKLVREWDGAEQQQVIWGSGFLFTRENQMVKCVDALSGVHVASFSVLGVKDFQIHGTVSLFPDKF